MERTVDLMGFLEEFRDPSVALLVKRADHGNPSDDWLRLEKRAAG